MNVQQALKIYLAISAVAGIITLIIGTYKYLKKQKNKTVNPIQPMQSIRQEEIRNYDIGSLYQPKYLLSPNEKNQYRKLQSWAISKNLIIFTKVRLLDLVEPKNYVRNNNKLLWKIQAKHVDFVICDQNIRVKCIVEISDSSHFRPDRIERDRFVREVLEACGYRLIQTFNITEELLNKVCGYEQIFRNKETEK